MRRPVEIAQGIYRLRGAAGPPFQLPDIYFVAGEYGALVETGPASTAPQIRRALEQLNWDREKVKYLIPTHIHLDHGGGAGLLVRELLQAQVVAYSKAAPHLLKPTRLIEGTRQAFGADFEKRFGPILPVPRERLLAVDEGTRLDLGGRELEVYYTPGHASHHLSLFDHQTKALFCGEALGHYLPDREVIRPAVTVPMFEVDQALASIAKLQRLKPKLLIFAQYGVSADPERLFPLAEQAVKEYSGVVLEALRQGLSQKEVARRLAEFEWAAWRGQKDKPVPEDWRYHYRQMAAGLSAYFQRKSLV